MACLARPHGPSPPAKVKTGAGKEPRRYRLRAPVWQRMQALWEGQRARRQVARSAEEVEAERQAVRDEWEERMRRIEQIQAEAARARRGQGA